MTIHHTLDNHATARSTKHEDPLDAFDHEAAHRDGWTISDCGTYSDGSSRVELQKLDSPPPGSPTFPEDRDVWVHVVQHARRGSFLHSRALELVDRREKLAIDAHCGNL